MNCLSSPHPWVLGAACEQGLSAFTLSSSRAACLLAFQQPQCACSCQPLYLKEVCGSRYQVAVNVVPRYLLEGHHLVARWRKKCVHFYCISFIFVLCLLYFIGP